MTKRYRKPSPEQAPLLEKVSHLPETPGVYIYKDVQGDILYIGKAKALRRRVRSYFNRSNHHSMRIGLMVFLARDLEVILTETEAEALILEAQMIRQHQPRYNVMLKDDKSYPYFKLTNEMFPRLLFVRELGKLEKGARYFGPYPSATDARRVLKVVNRFFRLRTSKMDLDGSKTFRPCLNYQMRRCLAPCQGTVTEEDYQQEVQQVKWFLQGKDKELIQELQSRMERYSQQLDFEKAAQMRDQMEAVRNIFEKQVVLTTDMSDQDVFSLKREAGMAGVQVLFIRSGRLLGTDFFFFDDCDAATDDNLLGQVLNRIYAKENPIVPQKILLSFSYADQEPLSEWLSEIRESKVEILVPQKGKKKDLILMAQKNASERLEEKKRQHIDDQSVLEQVKSALHLDRLPDHVEAFDISNTSGTNAVASMVCWRGNHPDKNGYRKFKIKTVEGPNDFASMEEVLTRRYRKCAQGEEPLPDLILIDGGKGQLNMAVRVLEELGISLKEVDVIGLAKGRSDKRQRDRLKPNTREDDFEYVVKPQQKNEIRLTRHSSVIYFLQRIRDESHRFAITFHRQLRQKEQFHSVLDDINGVGKKRKQDLLKHFGSLKRIEKASLKELELAPGISSSLAQTIFERFHSSEEKTESAASKSKI